jgi:hypothetical protein
LERDIQHKQTIGHVEINAIGGHVDVHPYCGPETEEKDEMPAAEDGYGQKVLDEGHFWLMASAKGIVMLESKRRLEWLGRHERGTLLLVPANTWTDRL